MLAQTFRRYTRMLPDRPLEVWMSATQGQSRRGCCYIPFMRDQLQLSWVKGQDVVGLIRDLLQQCLTGW